MERKWQKCWKMLKTSKNQWSAFISLIWIFERRSEQRLKLGSCKCCGFGLSRLRSTKHQAPPGIATGGAGGASTIVLASVISAAEFSLNCGKHKHEVTKQERNGCLRFPQFPSIPSRIQLLLYVYIYIYKYMVVIVMTIIVIVLIIRELAVSSDSLQARRTCQIASWPWPMWPLKATKAGQSCVDCKAWPCSMLVPAGSPGMKSQRSLPGLTENNMLSMLSLPVTTKCHQQAFCILLHPFASFCQVYMSSSTLFNSTH